MSHGVTIQCELWLRKQWKLSYGCRPHRVPQGVRNTTKALTENQKHMPQGHSKAISMQPLSPSLPGPFVFDDRVSNAVRAHITQN